MINLNTVIAAVSHQDDIIALLGDARWLIELTKTLAKHPNLQQSLAHIISLVTDAATCKITKYTTYTLHSSQFQCNCCHCH